MAEKIPEHESDEYFSTRPRVKQLGAWASHQSHSFNDLVEFSDRISDVTQQFKDEKIIPRPPTWGGYVVKPTRFEFWLEGEGRLHTRVMFSKKRSKFIREYLYP